MVIDAMSKCARCGIPYHPELATCPLCNTRSAKEEARRSKLWFLTNTIAVSFVALVVLVRAVTSADIAVGMTQTDCQSAQVLLKETRYAVQSLASDQERGIAELSAVGAKWTEMSERYTPGKHSWSASGLEHNWLQRLGETSTSIANGEEPKIESDALTAEAYLLELTKLYPRYCD